MLLGNGLWSSTGFNSRLQVGSMSLGTSSGAGDIWSLTNTYSATQNNGNVLGQSLTVPGAGTINSVYTYDAINRLSTAAEKSSNPSNPPCPDSLSRWCRQYNYYAGGYGNRKTANSSGQGISPLEPASFNSSNQIADAGWSYTERNSVQRGNVSKQQTGETFAYDAENHQIAYCPQDASPANCVPTVGNGRTLYVYDGSGRRVETLAPGGPTTVFVYDASGQLAAESTLSGTTAPTLCGTCYLTTDHLGSTRAVTDGSGCAVYRQDYLPFGETILAQGVDPRLNATGGVRCGTNGYAAMASPRIQFTGKERDAESGLDWFKTRYMSSAQGRFTSPDPLGAAAGKEGDPQSWNLYAYSRNNPLLYTDPDGLTFRICDTSGTCDDNYSDANFYKNLDTTSKNGNIYDNNGTKIGTYQRTSFDDLGPLGNSLYFGMAQRRQASNQFIGAFAAASVVAGTGVGIGLQATGGAGLTTLDSAAPYLRYTSGQLNQIIGDAQRVLLRDLLGDNVPGATSRLENFRVPEGLSQRTLEIYKDLAERVIQRGPGAPGLELQKLRLEIVNKALQAFK